jgi:hypothetical protein
MMETYHKIQTLFKRHLDGPKKGKMIRGDWTTPELEYLANNQWEFTEKVDGTNIRIGYDPNLHPSDQVRFAGRSDNAQIPKPLLDYLMSTFTTYPYHVFDDAVPPRVTLFGEGYGPNIQGGGKYRSDPAFVLFDVKISNWWLKRADVDDIACKLGIESVPTIGTGTLQDAIDIVSSGITFDHNGVVQRWYTSIVGGLESRWGPFEAEGIVARPVVPLFDRKGQRIITKIKSVDFN